MADVLIHADTLRSPEMRHEVPVSVPDPFLYVERNGDRHVVITQFETERVQGSNGLQPHPYEQFGWDDLVAQGIPLEEVELQTYVRACKELGVENAVVPPSFPLELADRLRAEGVELKTDRDAFVQRRRKKTQAELEGIRRAQRGAEAALDAARDLMRRSEPNGDSLDLDGEPLTAERIKAAMRQAYGDHDLLSDEFIVAPGAQGAMGHEMGHGPIAPGQPVVIDQWPKDPASSCYTDMTRTYVVGEVPEEIQTYQRLVHEALERSIEMVKPGVAGRDIYVAVCELFHEAGFPTGHHKPPGEILEDGFFHGLGHGVGLEVHEQPWLSRYPGELVEGDVITLEPGLYRQGFGGVRLEDIVVVTKDGGELITQYPYDLAP
jgi:Xaa-Pro aminopeptidase